ncbi:MAG: hypothetical protein ACLP1X_21630 [Polyangiaceae bacterium]
MAQTELAWYPCADRSSAIEPIEVSVASETRGGPLRVEIAIGSVVLSREAGVDVAYVAVLVHALCER